MAKVIFAATMDGSAISNMIADLSKRSKAMIGDVHTTACSVIAHAVKHGDATMATHMPDRVTEALGGAWRLNALRSWFEAMGPFKWHAKDGDKPAGFKIDKDKRKLLASDLEKLGEADFLAKLIAKKTFHEFKPEAEYEVYSWKAALAKAIKYAMAKQKDETRKAKGKDDFEGLTEAQELLAKLSEPKAKVAKAKKAKAKAA